MQVKTNIFPYEDGIFISPGWASEKKSLQGNHLILRWDIWNYLTYSELHQKYAILLSP